MRYFSFIILLAGYLYGSSELFVSFVGMGIDYKEYEQDSVLDSESSDYRDITGVELGYKYTITLKQDLLLRGEINYTFLEGNSRYIGSLQGSNQPYGSVQSITYNTINELGLRLKAIWLTSSKFNFKAFLGFGYYKWDRKLSSIQTESYYWYPLELGLGTAFRFSQNDPNSFNIDFFYKRGLAPRMKDKYNNIIFVLGGEYNYGAVFSYIYELNSSVELFAEYKYSIQKIKKSNVVSLNATTIAWEPKSKDTQQFIKIGLAYKF